MYLVDILHGRGGHHPVKDVIDQRGHCTSSMGIDVTPHVRCTPPKKDVDGMLFSALDLLSSFSVPPPHRLMLGQVMTVTEHMEHLSMILAMMEHLSMILAMMLLVTHIMKHLALYTLLHRTLILQQALNMPLPHTQSGDMKGLSAPPMLLPHQMEPSKHLSLTKLA